MNAVGDTQWLSAYLFFNAPLFTAACDRVLLDFVAPFVAQCRQRRWIASYFFVRYAENGPHIRLRLRGSADVLWECVRPALLDAVGDADRALITAMCFEPYVPEFDRYGGTRGLPIAEQSFHASSETAVALLATMDRERRAARLGKGTALLVTLLHAFATDRSHAARLADAYGQQFLRSVVPEDGSAAARQVFGDAYDRQAARVDEQVTSVWDALESGEEIPEPLHTYALAMREARAGALFESIVYSYAHMMNNRLGVSVAEESYLAYLVHRALRPEHG